MTTEIRSRNVRMPAALAAYAERRLRFALGRFSRRIGRVMVRFSDVNGPLQGVDKHCLIEARVIGGEPLFAEDTAASLSVALDRAAARLSRAVRRTFRRKERPVFPRPVGGLS